MDGNLEHEDLLIKLRAKLNEDKIKLWEPPYISDGDAALTPNLMELAGKYAESLSLNRETVLTGLYELQQHSLERSKAIEEFKETGFATFRVKVTLSGQRPQNLNIQKKLDVLGSELIDAVAAEVGVKASRVKLIYNGKVIKPTSMLVEQGLKNAVQMMALILAASREAVVQEDKIYKEMKSTLDDATLLAEPDDLMLDDDDYMKLEDQSGTAIELPPAERRSLMVGLALHERGRFAAKQQDYSLALMLFLEADRQLNECRSSILSKVDNWAVLQLDIAWCYLCLRSLASAGDAADRLAKAEKAFKVSYGEDHERLIALKGTAANERVLLMRLHLLQGIVAYHQNKREVALRLLERAESELNSLKVDDNAVTALMELGWTSAQARSGLRASNGDPERAHNYLADRRQEREAAREKHRQNKQRRLVGTCADGSPVSAQLVEALQQMGYERALATTALRHSNNNVAEAVRLIQDHPDLLIEDDEEPQTPTNENLPENEEQATNRMLSELVAMGYTADEAALALRLARRRLPRAAQLLARAAQRCDLRATPSTSAGPSTSADDAHRRLRKYLKMQLVKRHEREAAFKRLAAGIRADEDEHLDAALDDEQHFLAQYKSLL